MKIRNILVVSLLMLAAQVFASGVTFNQVASNAAPAGLTKDNDGMTFVQFDPYKTGFSLLVENIVNGRQQTGRRFVLANQPGSGIQLPNNDNSFTQPLLKVQPLAGMITNFDFDQGVYIAPYFKDKKTGAIVTDLSKISAANPAVAWVALFNANKDLLMNQQLSFDNPQGQGIIPALNKDVVGVSRITLQAMTGPEWNINVQLGQGQNSFAVSSSKQTLTDLVANSIDLSASMSDLVTSLTNAQKVIQTAIPQLQSHSTALSAAEKAASQKAAAKNTASAATAPAASAAASAPATKKPSNSSRKKLLTLEELLAEGKSKRTAEAILRKQKLKN